MYSPRNVKPFIEREWAGWWSGAHMLSYNDTCSLEFFTMVERLRQGLEVFAQFWFFRVLLGAACHIEGQADVERGQAQRPKWVWLLLRASALR